MLKRIATSDVKLGMYLHSMEGAWLSHPFWRTRFVLADPADLVALKASAVQAVWIDASKGADVAEAYLDVVARYLGEEREMRFVDYQKPGLFKRMFGGK